jgi:hypothetical protein
MTRHLLGKPGKTIVLRKVVNVFSDLTRIRRLKAAANLEMEGQVLLE